MHERLQAAAAEGRTRARLAFARAAVIAAAVVAAPAATAQSLTGDELVAALEQGGYVLVMRNARSQAEPPEDGEEAPGNVHGERELDQRGQGQMAALSYAFRELDLPVGETLTSPAYRSVQSANYFGFGERSAVDGLAADADPAWLERRVTQAPPEGVNTLLVTHASLIEAGLGDAARDPAPGEMLVFRPGGAAPELVARLTVRDWAEIAVD